MIVLEKFQAIHFEKMKEEPSVAPLLAHFTPLHAKALEATPYAYTIMDGANGRVLMCAGISEYWAGRGEAWAMLASGLGHSFVPATKMVKRFLEVCPIRRIEAAVVIDHGPGHRWAQLVGFQLEAPLVRAYTPAGEDCSLYARIRRAG